MEVTCPYCGKPAELVDSKVVYGRSRGLIWICAPCDAYVGTHNCPGHCPLGRLADKELREWKRRAHQVFDAWWQSIPIDRKSAYLWLGGAMGLPPHKAHIGEFDVEQCKKLIELVPRIPK
jgi:hypothetical protein